MALNPNYPNGFTTSVTIREVPVSIAQPGQVYWVYGGSAILPGQRGGSNSNRGTFNSPFATIAYAITQCVANRGDIIMVKAGHTETVSSATTMLANIAGVAVIGLGTGSLRPNITLNTANTATIPVSADNFAFKNMIFTANFLAIAACFTVTAKNFAVEDCSFYDTSGVLNFLNIVNASGGANTADGLRFVSNEVINQSTSNGNTTLLLANTVDRLVATDNYIRFPANNDKAILSIVTTGILTNARVLRNMCYRPNTTTAGGSLITVGGATSTGIVALNYVQTLTTTSDLLFTTTVGLAAFDNRVTGVVGASGFLIPAADS